MTNPTTVQWFSSLNPQMGRALISGVNQLSFDCPGCGFRISIYCRLGGPADESKHIWAWEGDLKNPDWDKVTIKPSIGDHAQGRNWPKCFAHISIIRGKVQ